jgi:hypothetical protein
MDHTSIASQSQDPVHVQSKIDDFFGRFKIATLMHRCGMRKHHGQEVGEARVLPFFTQIPWTGIGLKRVGR